jgi:hypothetical protein
MVVGLLSGGAPFHFAEALIGNVQNMAAKVQSSTSEQHGQVTKKVKIALEDLAKTHAPDALKMLALVMKNSRHPAGARVSAAVAMLDRGYGKPREAIEHSGEVDVMPKLSEPQLDALIERLSKKA